MVYIFKTNVKTRRDMSSLKPHIDSNFPGARWNFDLEDCDKIFRIESQATVLEKVIEVFQSLGYRCEELPD